MRILAHDYSGHPFQAELSAELARRGHQVTHSYCAAYVSGKGNLERSEPGLTFGAIGVGRSISKTRFARRLVEELAFGVALIRQARRMQPDVAMFANVPVPTLLLVVSYLTVARVPWLLWHQDIQSVAIRQFAGGGQIPVLFRPAARVVEMAERWCARRAAAIVVISDAFLDVHRRWGTADRAHVVANWAPLDEIVPVSRDNAWSREHGLDDTLTLLYSGTLGLKHQPQLLPELARQVLDAGREVRLVVVNEGPAVPVLRERAEELGVPLTLLPFQPYERLPEVLGSGDVLVVLLEPTAGAFSVPSKTLSYLCAGRPVLGLMPAENLAARLISEAGGEVLPPHDGGLGPAAGWVSEVLGSTQLRDELGQRARKLAEREFSLTDVADTFESLLSAAASESVSDPRA